MRAARLNMLIVNVGIPIFGAAARPSRLDAFPSDHSELAMDRLDSPTRAARLDTLRDLVVQSVGSTSQGPPQNQPEEVPSEIWAYNPNPGPQDEFLAPAPTPTPDLGIDSSNWACPICQDEVVAGEVREVRRLPFGHVFDLA
jgi:hypothetical protein